MFYMKFENVHSASQNFKATRCSVIFRNVIFFAFIKEYYLLLCNRFLWQALTYCIEISPME